MKQSNIYIMLVQSKLQVMWKVQLHVSEMDAQHSCGFGILAVFEGGIEGVGVRIEISIYGVGITTSELRSVFALRS